MTTEPATGCGEQAGQFKLIEVDRMTGWERYLDNMQADPWSGTFTREQAEASVKWREEHIVGRYGYRIVPVEPHMTDNDAARERHDGRHGSFRMEDCGDVDCHAATMRLLAGQHNRRSSRRDRKDRKEAR
jgi:hypothetical protein